MPPQPDTPNPLLAPSPDVTAAAVSMCRAYGIQRARQVARRSEVLAERGADAPRAPSRRGDGRTRINRRWLELAHDVVAMKIDPEDCVRRCFDGCSAAHRPPRVDELLSHGAAAEYRQRRRSADEARTVELSVEQQIAMRHVATAELAGAKDDAAWAQVLLSDSVPLSALFRFGVASSIGSVRFDAIAADFRTGAALQLMVDRVGYEKLWGREWIPEGFADEAARIEEKLYGGR